MIKRLRLASIALACLCASSVKAADPHFSIAIMAQAPYGVMHRDGKKEGYLFDIAEKLTAETALSIDVQLRPHKRLIEELKANHHACTFFAATDFALSFLMPVEPIGKIIPAAVLGRTGVNFKKYDDLYGKVIAVPRGVHFSQRFDNDEKIKIHPTLDYKHSAMMLKRGRVDAMAGALDSMYYNMDLVDMAKKETGTPLHFSSYPIWLMCRPDMMKHPFIKTLQAKLADLREDRTIQNIIDKYMPQQ